MTYDPKYDHQVFIAHIKNIHPLILQGESQRTKKLVILFLFINRGTGGS